MAFLNTISFPMEASRVTYYSTGDNAVFVSCFDTTNNLMVLEVSPGGYTPRVRALGRTEVIEAITSEVVPTPATRQEAIVEVPKAMIVVAEVLNELRQNAIDDGTYKITVRDGCMVEFADRAQGYTTRGWWLALPVVPEAANANLGPTGERIYSGYTLDFTIFGQTK